MATYEFYDGKMLGGDYVNKNRKAILKKIPKDFLINLDSLILIEKVVYLEKYYNCAVFSDSLRYFFQAQGLENPQLIDLSVNPLHKPKLALYIFNSYRKGEIFDILEESKKTTIMTPSNSVFLTIVKIDHRKINVKGYDLNEFIPKEKLRERDSLIMEIKKRSSN
ncbi:MAG: hypothetical protein JJU28_22640 [Cyclobacteriaceae bacterium]|nr:hypothetical protein [Cyclobacteriaceae bacterium]